MMVTEWEKYKNLGCKSGFNEFCGSGSGFRVWIPDTVPGAIK
jgi:hypothetical protein